MGKRAVVFVDVQKDFIDGELRNEQAIKVLPKIVEFAKTLELGKDIAYFTRDTHEKTVYGSTTTGENAVESGYKATLEGKSIPEHCIAGTPGWMIDSGLWDAVTGTGRSGLTHIVVDKPTFGSYDLVEEVDDDFSYEYSRYWNGDDEEVVAHGHGLDEIVLCGFCTSICVLANAVMLRAKFPNTRITVYENLCADVTPEAHEAALKAFVAQQIDVRTWEVK